MCFPRSLSFFAFIACARLAALELASPFGDHMVLQQGRPLPVWGWAQPGEQIVVNFAGVSGQAVANAEGEWSLTLPPLAPSAEPRSFVVSGAQSLTLNDVLVGEVWLCGGQSNMERQLGLRPGQQPLLHWEADVAGANFPQIRQLYVTQTRAETPQKRVNAKWSVCSPDTASEFTAVGFYFARALHQAKGVPIGILHSSWGGTPAEAWTSAEALTTMPDFADTIAEMKASGPEREKVRQRAEQKLADWFRANDPGSGDQPWSAAALTTSDWVNLQQPQPWESQGHDGFDGVVWLRRQFDLPAGWQGEDLELRLGAIDDADTTWVNGQSVGSTQGWNTPRVYRVPASLLRPTGNVIAVRVLDTGGFGGIWDDKQPLALVRPGRNESLPLNGTWQARFGLRFSRDLRAPALAIPGAGTPTVLYNGMIAPLIPYALRGVTFYQGEANAGRSDQYRTLFPTLIADWRQRWQEGDFPFLFVQIAPFKDQPPEIREAQWLAWKSTPNTALAVTLDCGDANDIHPTDKGPVGERLALAARALAYNEPVPYSGPSYREMSVQGREVVLRFQYDDTGLVAPGGKLEGFTVAGADGVFHPAEARIVERTVVVSSAQVASPTAVRYAWANVARGNLFNRAGLPASPFRTDHP